MKYLTFSFLVLISCNVNRISKPEILQKPEINMNQMKREMQEQSISFNNELKMNSEGTEYLGKDSTIIEIEDNFKTGQGRYAIDKDGNISNYKIGEHKEFYKNGNVKSIVEYNIGSYVHCCVDGPCRLFYNYKINAWKSFYLNAKPKISATLVNFREEVNNYCEESDSICIARINEIKYWDENGNEIPTIPNYIVKEITDHHE